MHRHAVFDSRGDERPLLPLPRRWLRFIEPQGRRLLRVRRGITGPLTGEWGPKAAVIAFAGGVVIMLAPAMTGYNSVAPVVLGSIIVLGAFIALSLRRKPLKRQT